MGDPQHRKSPNTSVVGYAAQGILQTVDNYGDVLPSGVRAYLSGVAEELYEVQSDIFKDLEKSGHVPLEYRSRPETKPRHRLETTDE